MVTILEAKNEDARFYVEHSERQFNTNGENGIIFSPREAGTYKASDKDVEAVENRWSKEVNEPAYEKAWLVWNNKEVVGHILLRKGWLESQSHRIELQMGLEPDFRGKGLGKKLLELAIDWAKGNTNFEWVDLAVFGQNDAAVGLYRKFGFIEVGRIVDRFRVCGQSVDNVEMVLKIQR